MQAHRYGKGASNQWQEEDGEHGGDLEAHYESIWMLRAEREDCVISKEQPCIAPYWSYHLVTIVNSTYRGHTLLYGPGFHMSPTGTAT